MNQFQIYLKEWVMKGWNFLMKLMLTGFNKILTIYSSLRINKKMLIKQMKRSQGEEVLEAQDR